MRAMHTFKSIAVYCGSNDGNHPRYVQAAREAGTFLARRGIDVVYGGGRVGLMGAVADAALAAGAKVVGVIPEQLKVPELAHTGLTELFVVPGMHARKTKMASLADGFLALPGGFGTLEEVFEVVTWSMLNYHRKPVGLLNVGGFYDQLVRFVDHVAEQGFIRPHHRPLLASADSMEEILDRMANMVIPDVGRGITQP
jgi:uncharacterized protein (TIGR00730 family)